MNRPQHQTDNRAIIFIGDSSTCERPPRPSIAFLQRLHPKFYQIKAILRTTNRASLYALKHIATTFTPEIQPVDNFISRTALLPPSSWLPRHSGCRCDSDEWKRELR